MSAELQAWSSVVSKFNNQPSPEEGWRSSSPLHIFSNVFLDLLHHLSTSSPSNIYHQLQSNARGGQALHQCFFLHVPIFLLSEQPGVAISQLFSNAACCNQPSQSLEIENSGEYPYFCWINPKLQTSLSYQAPQVWFAE